MTMHAYTPQNQETPLKACPRQDMPQIKKPKNSEGASRGEYAHNATRKAVRSITSSCLSNCRKFNNNLLFIHLFFILQSCQIGIMKVKTLSTAEAAMGKSTCCRYSAKWVFLKILQKFTRKFSVFPSGVELKKRFWR